VIEERINEDGSIPAINRCMYLEFDPEYARRMMEMPGLEAWWKEQAPQKLKGQEHEDQADHWTLTMKDGGN
jgi:hypothetical protein